MAGERLRAFLAYPFSNQALPHVGTELHGRNLRAACIFRSRYLSLRQFLAQSQRRIHKDLVHIPCRFPLKKSSILVNFYKLTASAIETVWSLRRTVVVSLMDALVAVDELLADFVNGVDGLALADIVVPLEVFVVELAESVGYWGHEKMTNLGRQ